MSLSFFNSAKKYSYFTYYFEYTDVGRIGKTAYSKGRETHFEGVQKTIGIVHDKSTH